MEACGSAHHWGRQIRELGHEVVLISPQYVRPYVPRDKTDRADVKGLFEAYRNSDIRPVPIKTLSQQQLTALQRIRSTWMRTRVTRINMVRGLLREFGFVIPVGARHLVPGVMELIEDAEVEIPSVVREMLDQVCGEIGELESGKGSIYGTQTPSACGLVQRTLSFIIKCLLTDPGTSRLPTALRRRTGASGQDYAVGPPHQNPAGDYSQRNPLIRVRIKAGIGGLPHTGHADIGGML